MSSICVNPPKTPVTEGSHGVATATLPNVCKMPGPPAPFVPTPLPNVGQSGDNLKGGTRTVLFEGKKVAIKGSYFMSVGDIASKGTGGGIISAHTQGKTEWIAPGSMDVKAEGKNIQLLGDAMTNNGGSPANAGTPTGEIQAPLMVSQTLKDIVCKCNREVKAHKQSTCRQLGNEKHACCNKAVQQHKNRGEEPKLAPERGYDKEGTRLRMTREQAVTSGKIKGTRWPDACTLDDNGNPSQLFDFKFKCPAGTRTRKKKGGGWATCSGNQGFPGWSPGQLKKYKNLSTQLGIDLTESPPQIIDTCDCK